MRIPHTCVLVFASLMLLAIANAFASADKDSNALQTSQPASIQLNLSKQGNVSVHLEARQAPLAQILKVIADKTGVLIHYSVLPDAPVTATCVGANVEQVMECLLARQVGLVARKSQKNKPAEFWLLGSSVGSCQVVTVAPSTPVSPLPAQSVVEQQPTLEQQADMNKVMQEQSDQLIEQAKSKIPGERQIAIMNLGSVGLKDDPDVDKTLNAAMTDKEPSVRVLAVNAIARRGGDNTGNQLAQAIKDQDASVRATAVGLIENDTNLLQQALADSDQTVRDAARAKLEELTLKQDKRK